MTWIKICGTTNLDDALIAVEAGADAVGFVFYGKSPRNITAEKAREIVEKLPENVEKVGVFVGETAETLREISEKAELTIVQAYPDFGSPLSTPNDRFLEETSYRVIVALSATQLQHEESDDPDVITGFRVSDRFRNRIAAVLLDSGTSSVRGGTGKTFEWQSVVPMTDLMGRAGLKLIVAGGLTAGNVGDAIRTLTPWGVDVASGVEARPGKKDPEKVRSFVKAVREMDRKAN
ncbi:MAG: phosphoribosylanthranilate isomerase [Candidatus Sulfotelmatobacter sp.]